MKGRGDEIQIFVAASTWLCATLSVPLIECAKSDVFAERSLKRIKFTQFTFCKLSNFEL